MPATAATTAPLAVVLRSVFVVPVIAKFVVVAFVEVELTANRLVMSALDAKKFVLVALVEVLLVTVRLFPTAFRKVTTPVLSMVKSVVVAEVLVVEEMLKRY